MLKAVRQWWTCQRKSPTLREAEAYAFVAMSQEGAAGAATESQGRSAGSGADCGHPGRQANRGADSDVPPLPLSKVDMRCEVKSEGVEIRSVVRTTAVTGVEMEALVAASVAALTVYDMCKALDKGIADLRGAAGAQVRRQKRGLRAPERKGQSMNDGGRPDGERFCSARRARRSARARNRGVLRKHGFEVIAQRAVVDEQSEIERTLMELPELVRLIVTTGGTGIAERDVTPEATRAVCSQLIDGIPKKFAPRGWRRHRVRGTEPRSLRRARQLADSESSRQSRRRSGIVAIGDRDFAAC